MDHWVDRPEVQARQRAQPTGTNRPTRTTRTHTHPPAPAPERAGAGGEPDPASTTQPRTNPPHPPQGGGRPPGAAHHNPTTVPAATAGGETPGPIPNPEAKPPSANGTAPTRERKSRTPPEHTPTNRPRHPARGVAGPRRWTTPQPERDRLGSVSSGRSPAPNNRTRRTPPPHGRRDAAKAAKGEETQRSKPRWRAPTSPVSSLTPITPTATLTET